MRTSGAVLLPHAPPSVAVARGRLVADLTAADIRKTAIDDAAVVVSELLSNAIRHAAPLPGHHVKLAWMLDDDMLHLAVSDGGAASTPRLVRPTATVPGGRGLGIVASLSARWGVRSDEEATTVWAILPAPHVGRPRGRVLARLWPRRGAPAVTGHAGASERMPTR